MDPKLVLLALSAMIASAPVGSSVGAAGQRPTLLSSKSAVAFYESLTAKAKTAISKTQKSATAPNTIENNAKLGASGNKAEVQAPVVAPVAQTVAQPAAAQPVIHQTGQQAEQAAAKPVGTKAGQTQAEAESPAAAAPAAATANTVNVPQNTQTKTEIVAPQQASATAGTAAGAVAGTAAGAVAGTVAGNRAAGAGAAGSDGVKPAIASEELTEEQIKSQKEHVWASSRLVNYVTIGSGLGALFDFVNSEVSVVTVSGKTSTNTMIKTIRTSKFFSDACEIATLNGIPQSMIASASKACAAE